MYSDSRSLITFATKNPRDSLVLSVCLQQKYQSISQQIMRGLLHKTNTKTKYCSKIFSMSPIPTDLLTNLVYFSISSHWFLKVRQMSHENLKKPLSRFLKCFLWAPFMDVGTDLAAGPIQRWINIKKDEISAHPTTNPSSFMGIMNGFNIVGAFK